MRGCRPRIADEDETAPLGQGRKRYGQRCTDRVNHQINAPPFRDLLYRSGHVTGGPINDVVHTKRRNFFSRRSPLEMAITLAPA